MYRVLGNVICNLDSVSRVNNVHFLLNRWAFSNFKLCRYKLGSHNVEGTGQ